MTLAKVSCERVRMRREFANGSRVKWIGSRVMSYQRSRGVKIGSRKVRKDAKEEVFLVDS